MISPTTTDVSTTKNMRSSLLEAAFVSIEILEVSFMNFKTFENIPSHPMIKPPVLRSQQQQLFNIFTDLS